MSRCALCGQPIVVGERMVARTEAESATWNAEGVLITPQPVGFTPYHQRCLRQEPTEKRAVDG